MHRSSSRRITENGGWDDAILQAELGALLAEKVDLTALGFAELELKRILDEIESQGEPIDEDAALEPPQQPITQVGDLWDMATNRVSAAAPKQLYRCAAVLLIAG
jgi:hypothetical protein